MASSDRLFKDSSLSLPNLLMALSLGECAAAAGLIEARRASAKEVAVMQPQDQCDQLFSGDFVRWHRQGASSQSPTISLLSVSEVLHQ